MKETFWSYLFIVLGLLTIAIMILVQNLTSTSEENYYLTKEVMEASMIDSIDYGLYRKTGEIRMIESKFVENFTRRFAESINDSKEYTLDFYEIYENPPKATVVVKTETGSQTITSDSTVNFDIRTVMSGILETKYSQNDSVLAVDLTTDKGTVLGKTKYTSYEGRVIFEVNAPVPYVVEGSTITCGDNGVNIETKDNQVIISNVRRNTSCNAKLAVGKSVTLTMNSGTGQVIGDKIKAAVPGGSVSFEAQATDGYTLENPTVICSGGATGSRSGNKIVVSNVNTDQICDVTLKRGKYKVTINVINGGTTLTNPVEIAYGDTQLIPIYANLGYTTKDMKVTCSRGASATLNDNVISLSNVYASQTCTVEVPEITSDSYPYFVSKGNGIYDITLIDKTRGNDDRMKTTYNWNGYDTKFIIDNNKETFTKKVNKESQSNNGVTLSIVATNIGDSLAVSYILTNNSSTTKNYAVSSTADIYLVGNDCITIYKDTKDGNNRLYTGKYGQYWVEYLFDPTATTTWIGNFSSRDNNRWNNSNNCYKDWRGSEYCNNLNTGNTDSGLAFSWSGTIGAEQTLVKTVKFIIHKD